MKIYTATLDLSPSQTWKQYTVSWRIHLQFDWIFYLCWAGHRSQNISSFVTMEYFTRDATDVRIIIFTVQGIQNVWNWNESEEKWWDDCWFITFHYKNKRMIVQVPRFQYQCLFGFLRELLRIPKLHTGGARSSNYISISQLSASNSH